MDSAASGPVERLLHKLDHVRDRGNGQWITQCPAHDDHTPSLSIGEGDDGRALIHCFGGCSAREVMSALGLSLGDLYCTPPPAAAPRRPQDGLLKAREVLDVWANESLIVAIAAHDIAEGRALSKVDADRVALAAARLQWVRRVARL